MTDGGPRAPLDQLRQEAASCRACPLWRDSTQTVFGEGDAGARLMLVGEQPGDSEDIEGRPFVGPAGRLLDQALAEAGVDRSRVYVTNAVKHFKFEPRGKRRLHKRPNGAEISACRPWLAAEIEAVDPCLVVALGATALQSLTGRALPIGANRGVRLETSEGRPATATTHPSALLRLRDSNERQVQFARFVDDLRGAAELADRIVSTARAPRPPGAD